MIKEIKLGSKVIINDIVKIGGKMRYNDNMVKLIGLETTVIKVKNACGGVYYELAIDLGWDTWTNDWIAAV